MSERTLDKLAKAVGVTISELFQDKSVNLIPLVGKIGAGAIVHRVEGDEGIMGYVDAPPQVAPGGLIAFEIEGFSMPPFKPGNKVFVRADGAVDPLDHLNDMCLVQVKDGPRLFKVLRRGYEPGTFNLESLDGQPPLENVKLEWVAPLIAVTFS